MLWNVPRHKDGPASTGKRMAGRLKIVQSNHSAFSCRKQPPPRESRKARSAPANHPEGFVCAWCGLFHPWSEMAGFDRRLKFCDKCVRLMDALEIGLATITTNVARRST